MPKKQQNTTKSLLVGAQHDPWMKIGSVIAIFDPGLTTGYARMRFDGGTDVELLDTFEIPWEDRFGIGDHIDGVDFVVMERFQLYASHAKEMINDQFPSVWISGMIERECHIRNLDLALYLQMPSLMRSVSIPESMLTMTRGSEHRKDAVRHGRYFAIYWGRQSETVASRRQALLEK